MGYLEPYQVIAAGDLAVEKLRRNLGWRIRKMHDKLPQMKEAADPNYEAAKLLIKNLLAPYAKIKGPAMELARIRGDLFMNVNCVPEIVGWGNLPTSVRGIPQQPIAAEKMEHPSTLQDWELDEDLCPYLRGPPSYPNSTDDCDLVKQLQLYIIAEMAHRDHFYVHGLLMLEIFYHRIPELGVVKLHALLNRQMADLERRRPTDHTHPDYDVTQHLIEKLKATRANLDGPVGELQIIRERLRDILESNGFMIEGRNVAGRRGSVYGNPTRRIASINTGRHGSITEGLRISIKVAVHICHGVLAAVVKIAIGILMHTRSEQ
ncbi:MAG: hypothetical protein Q9168_005061 [Polycauliona sp. 1 TL-2023]